MKSKRFWTIGGAIVLIAAFMLLFIFRGEADAASVTITFTATGDDGYTGTASKYLVYYSTQAFTQDDYLTIADTASFCPDPSQPGTTEYCELSELQDDIDYWILVRVVDESGNWSEPSNIIRVTAKDVEPPAAITDLNGWGGR